MLKCQRDFTETVPYKNTIEKILYSRARMVSHVDGVTGPNIGRHIENYRSCVALSAIAKIRVIDRDKDIHAQHIEWKVRDDGLTWEVKEEADTGIWPEVIGIESLREKVALTCASIEDIKDPARFFDADLMGTVEGSTGRAIKTVLTRQAKLYSSDEARQLKKALVFTFSLRGANEAITIEWIETLINSTLNSICTIGGKKIFSLPRATGVSSTKFKGTSVHMYNCNFIKKGRVEDICIFYYNEGKNPMLTGIVVYR